MRIDRVDDIAKKVHTLAAVSPITAIITGFVDNGDFIPLLNVQGSR